MRGRTVRTAKKKRALLEIIASGRSVTAAARLAGMSRQAVYDWKQDDPIFARDLKEAYEEGTDRFADALLERALLPEHDALAIFLLKQRDPERFNRKMVDVHVAGEVQHDHQHTLGAVGPAGRPMLVRIRIPDNGRDSDPYARRGPTKRLPFELPEGTVEILDGNGKVISMTADGEQVDPDDIEDVVVQLNAFESEAARDRPPQPSAPVIDAEPEASEAVEDGTAKMLPDTTGWVRWKIS
jgi:hypothetical protein